MEIDGTWKDEADWRLSGFIRTEGWSKAKLVTFLGIWTVDTECIFNAAIFRIGVFIWFILILSLKEGTTSHASTPGYTYHPNVDEHEIYHVVPMVNNAKGAGRVYCTSLACPASGMITISITCTGRRFTAATRHRQHYCDNKSR